MSKSLRCPNCDSANLHASRTSANGGYGPSLLAGLARFLRPAQMDVVVCGDCGLMQLFAGEAERERLAEAPTWRRL